jgi:uncharacterized protein YqhQ
VRDCPPLLADADTHDRLPRLGGMARPDGVLIVSERHWAFAGLDGSIREGQMPAPRFDQIPLLRGMMKLAAAFAPVFRRTGVARKRERTILAGLIVAPLGLAFLPAALAWPVWGLLTVGLLAWIFRGRTLRLHGAEHRAIAAVEDRRLEATWIGAAQPTRFSPRCGTNFAALVLPVTALAERAWPFAPAVYTPLLVTILSLAVTMELWRVVQASTLKLTRVLLLPGLALQRLTTREPALDDTRVALSAVEAVLRRELG